MYQLGGATKVCAAGSFLCYLPEMLSYLPGKQLVIYLLQGLHQLVAACQWFHSLTTQYDISFIRLE